jgi:hypothetical protein
MKPDERYAMYWMSLTGSCSLTSPAPLPLMVDSRVRERRTARCELTDRISRPSPQRVIVSTVQMECKWA